MRFRVRLGCVNELKYFWTFKIRASTLTSLTIAMGQIRPELWGIVRQKMQLKARTNIEPQALGFESRLCHTELTSGKNGVGQH